MQLFLAGGGEMGLLTRSKDWSNTQVGDPDHWPQSLRTTVSILLNSKFPMFLFWGPELICFYNDAYRPSLGEHGKHPDILGKPAMDAWPEIWDTIKPLIDQVMSGGEATWSEEQLIPIYRNGKIEDVYWTFSYSPVRDESGKPAAVFVTCTETTEKVITRKKNEELEKEFRQLADSLPGLIWTTDNKGMQTFASKGWKKFTGVDPYDAITFREIVHPDDYDNIVNAWTLSLTKGQTYKIEVRLKNRNQEYEWFYANGEPIKNTTGEIEKWAGVFTNIHEQKKAEQNLTDAFKKIEENEKRLKIIIGASELGTWDWDLKTDRVTYSERYIEIFGYNKKDIISHEQLLSHLHPDDFFIREKAIQEALAGGNLNFKSRIVWSDKSIHWIDVKGKVFYNNKSQPAEIIGTVSDITQEKLHEQELIESEQTFRLLADSMPQIIWTGDKAGNLNYFNKSVFDYSGLTPEEITKNGWLQIIHPDEREQNISLWLDSVNSGNDFIIEHRFRRQDGEYRWQLSRAMPQKDAEGNILVWVGTSTDIHDQKMFSQELERKIEERTSQLKQMNNELAKSEERYHLMVGEVQDYAILYLNTNGIIENWNKGAEKIKGYKADEIIGRNFSIFYTKEDRESRLPQRLLEQAITYGKATHEGWRVKKDGSLFWGNIVLTALHDEQRNVIGFSKVTRDLTDKKQADDSIKRNADQLKQKNKELEKMNAELESFAYVSSHDLQEPLRKIQTFATLILEKEQHNLSDSGKDYFRRMQLAAKRMQLLINDLLSYSRAGTHVGAFVQTDLNEIIKEARTELKETLEEKHAIIEFEGMCAIHVIPFQFRQMMLNLFGNAIKFAKPNIPPHIHLKSELLKGEESNIPSLSPQKLYCHVSVSDNGIGFDPQYADRIFQVFQRLHGKDQYEGTGIGLAIVKKIVENHKGIITATGEPGKGARFDIYLPA